MYQHPYPDREVSHLTRKAGPLVLPSPAGRRLRLRVQGTVQGVGFRPFIHNLATRYGLGGVVRNDAQGVVIEVEGTPQAQQSFLERLPAELPPLAHLEWVGLEAVPALGECVFHIADSEGAVERFTLIAPDTATCPACLAELFDPAHRRHRHPFITCTHCGPRFTLIQDIPYDRVRTTMADFPLCPACEEEYRDAADRRFHAEPIACPRCGPRLSLLNARGQPLACDPLVEAVARLRAGEVLAVKGLGGFHLACDARNERAVADLRQRKHRDEKPFALMVRDVAAARRLCRVDPASEALLTAPERPIVLLPRRGHRPGAAGVAAGVAEGVAPGFRELGVMLPYTPIQHLLLADSGLDLVMTSGNRSDEPIAFRDADARTRLGDIADAFLTHDRDIHVRCDDSVVRPAPRGAQILRRARGYVPTPMTLHRPVHTPVLACGGELKNTFCLVRERFAFLSHHIGDLENEATYAAFVSGVAHFKRLFQIEPQVIVHDLHPDYLTTRYARAFEETHEVIGVQHHHAHVAAAMADNDLDGTVIGVAFDGTGYGTDGRLWGGEFLIADYRGFHRAAHWDYFALPGGAQAIREPWRVALSLLAQAAGDEVYVLAPRLLPRLRSEQIRTVTHMLAKAFNAPLSSGVGRLFDAAAALLLGRTHVTFEGQAAMALEQAADPDERRVFPLELPPLESAAETWRLPSAALIGAVAEGLLAGKAPAQLAARFHNTLAAAVGEVCTRLAVRYGLPRVVLSGGVFQNTLLLRRTLESLEQSGLQVFTHRRVPANDGGLSLGQALIGGQQRCV